MTMHKRTKPKIWLASRVPVYIVQSVVTRCALQVDKYPSRVTAAAAAAAVCVREFCEPSERTDVKMVIEELFVSDFVDIPVTDSHAALRSDRAFEAYRVRMESEENQFSGVRLDPFRPPFTFHYAAEHVVRSTDETTPPLNRIQRVSPTLYREAGQPNVVDAVPFGNAFAYSAEARFRDLKLPGGDRVGTFAKFMRHTFRFPGNKVSTVVNEAAGGRKLSIDQRGVHASGRPDAKHTVDMSVSVHMDRALGEDVDPSRVIVRLPLLEKTYNYEDIMAVKCTVAYRVPMSNTVVTGAFSVPELVAGRANVARKMFEYCVLVPYNGVFYTFVVSFRENVPRSGNADENDSVANGDAGNGAADVRSADRDAEGIQSLRIECRELIEGDAFARIAGALIEFFSYQYATFGGLVDEFLSNGPKWREFRRSVNDEVRASIDCMGLKPMCPCGSSDEEPIVPSNLYEDLTTYLGLKCMADLEPQMRLAFSDIDDYHPGEFIDFHQFETKEETELIPL